MEVHRSSLFTRKQRRSLARHVSFWLLLSIAAPWQAFADDLLYRETKENFAPHPFVQPDLSTGAFTQSRSIAVPPGRNGLQPDIKLTYNSSGGRQDSIVGYGWSLNIPYIERWNKNGVDKLYNQDLAHTFFSSSLSGELLPLGTTTPVNGSVLGVSVSTPRLLALQELPFAEFLDIAPSSASSSATDTPVVDSVPVSDLSTTTVVEDAVLSASLIPDATSSTSLTAAPAPSAAIDLARLPITAITEVATSEVVSVAAVTRDNVVQPNGGVTVRGVGNELMGERTATSKTFFYGYRQGGTPDVRTRLYTEPVHYNNLKTGQLDDIDTRVATTTSGFRMTHAPYQFDLDTKGTGHFLTVQHDGQLFSVDPVSGTEKRSRGNAALADASTTGRSVLYPDLLGAGIDMQVTALDHLLVKDAIIRDASAIAGVSGDYLEIPFLLSFASPVTVSSNGTTLASDTPLVSSSTVALTDTSGVTTFILPPTASASGADKASSSAMQIPIDIAYTATTSGFVMTKRIPLSFLKTATYPVRTDATFSFTVATSNGDGAVEDTTCANGWTECRPSASGNILTNADTNTWARAATDGVGNTRVLISRVFMPFDTRSLATGTAVLAATLYIKAGAIDSATTSMALIKTTQATSTNLTLADYSNLTLNNPPEGAARRNSTDWSGGGYVGWALNATGTTFVNPGGYTFLGIREATHDVDNVATANNTYYGVYYTMNEAGAGSAPYLEVTTGVSSGFNLLVEAQTNPTIVSTGTPRFSAVFVGATSTAVATQYEIQVSTSSTSWASLVWDSNQTSLSSSTASNVRTPDITYGGTALPIDRTKYYWRIRFWDQNGVGDWSTTGDYFVMNGNTDYSAKVEQGDFLRYSHTLQDTWYAYDKKGTRYNFGTASTSRIQNAATTSQIFRWYLDSTTDLNGNSVSYSYTTDSGQVYPATITYTNTATTTGAYAVEFVYEPRSDISTSSAAGFSVVTKQRVKEILVRTSGKITRRYQLSYTTGDNTARSLLARVQESGWNSANGTTTLPAMTLGYSTSSSVWTENTDPSKWALPGGGYNFVGANGEDNGARVVDLNGDGLPDISWTGQTFTGGWLNTGSTWATSSSTHLPLVQNGGDVGIRLGDVNGDGLLDQVQAISCYPGISCGAAAVNVVLTGTDWSSSGRTLPVTFVSTVLWQGGSSQWDYGYALVDVNGDGLADLVGHYGAYINDGTQWVYDGAWTLPVDYTFGHDNGVRIIDVNGDGMADVVVGNAARATYLNNGHGWDLSGTWVPPASFVFPDSGLRFIDLNGDGLPDLIDNSHVVYINTGTGWSVATGYFPVSPVWNNGPGAAYDQGVVIDDINGDGLPDVLQSLDGFNQCNCTNPIRHVWLKSGTKGDFLTSINTEKGGATSIAYSRTTKLDASGVQPNPTLQIGLDTVASVTTNPGFGGTPATTTYAYSGGSYYFADANNRQMAGFASSSQTNALGFTTRTKYHQGNTSDSSNGEFNDHVAKIGKPYRVEDLDQNGNVYARTVNKWARADYGDGRNFVKHVSTEKQVYDGDSTHRDTAAATTYDDKNGNPLLREDWGEVSGSSDGTFTDLGTDGASTTWSYAVSAVATSTLSLPSREFVVDQLGATVRDSKWYYDTLTFGSANKGNQTKEERLKSGSTYISTQKMYDSYGNVLTTIDPRGSTTTYSYDAFNLYPATSVNPLGQSTSFVYDYASGKIATTTDANARVFVTKYDGLGRTLEERQPDFGAPSTLVVKTKYTYTDSTSTPSSVLRQDYLTSATTTDQYTYLDGLGRTIQTKRKAETANGFITSDTIYNAIGQVGAKSLPYFTSSSAKSTATTTAYLYTNTTYDPASRPLTIANSVSTTTNTYNDWTLTVTDPLGNKKDLVKDAWGNLATVVEYLSATSSATTTYAWNRLGKLTKLTDAATNVRNFGYDTLGRLLTSEDLHAPADTLFGTTTYSYDDAGNTVTLLNPRNQTINYSYDKLNRPLTEDFTGATGTEVAYSYDSGTNGIGRLTQVAFQGNATTTYSYNPLGLTVSEAKKIGTSWGTTTTSYFRDGSLDFTVYPDASKVTYTYDAAGLLERVTNKEPSLATSSVITSIGYAPTGQVAVIAYANGMRSTSTYDQTKLYRLTGKVTKGATTLQNLAYNYDAAGNITQLSDLASTTARKSVNYIYDGLYRLRSASTTVVATNTASYLQSWTYDTLGNMLTAPLGTYTYAGTGYANPDAVTQVGLTNYSYDNSGNLLSYGSTTNTWDYHNYLTRTVVGSVSSASTSTATPAFVQGGINSTINSFTFGSAVATGSLIVVGVTTCCNGSIPATSTIDNKGNTYTKIAEAQSGQDYGALFYAKNVNGGSSFTVTNTFGGTLSVHQYSGVSTSSPLDKWSTAVGSSTAPNSGATTTTLGNELYVGLAWSMRDGDSWTAGSGYTLRTQETNNATLERHATEDRVTTTATTTAATFSVPTNIDWLAVMATFKPLVTTSGGSAGTTSTSTYLYDYAGSRVSYNDGATTTRYWGTLYQDTPGAYKKTKNVYVNGVLVATLEKTGTATMIPYYIATDHLGGTNVVANSSGVATETLDYFPYGGVRRDDKQSSFTESRQYIGQQFDSATSLNYLNARYYDSNRGQFLGEDPVSRDVAMMQKMPWYVLDVNVGAGSIDQSSLLTDPQLLNLFSYARTNPVSKSDPTGLTVKEFLSGSQSWGSYRAELSDPAQFSYLGSGSTPSEIAWNYSLNNPTKAGATVGVFAGLAAYSGVAALYAAPQALELNVSLAHATTRLTAAVIAANSVRSNLNTISPVLDAVGQLAPGSSSLTQAKTAVTAAWTQRVTSPLRAAGNLLWASLQTVGSATNKLASFLTPVSTTKTTTPATH